MSDVPKTNAYPGYTCDRCGWVGSRAELFWYEPQTHRGYAEGKCPQCGSLLETLDSTD